MEKHESKYCPQCGSVFICKVGDVLNCQCNNVSLTEKAKKILSQTFDDCLCRHCLEQLNLKSAD